LCTGGEELRESGTVPACLSTFRPHSTVNHPVEGRRMWKSHDLQDLDSELLVPPGNNFHEAGR
jgi:hypothetical protein